MKPYFLIGYMGCGKSTLGRALAKHLHWDFVDLDKYIESRFMRTIPDLFKQMGEDGFRRIERNMLHEVAERNDVVVACGGGTPCHYDNMAYMNVCGTTVWLEASEQRLLSRLCIRKHRRPLLASLTDDEVLQQIRTLLPGRIQYYSQAKYTLPSDKLENVREIDDTVQLFCQTVKHHVAQKEAV